MNTNARQLTYARTTAHAQMLKHQNTNAETPTPRCPDTSMPESANVPRPNANEPEHSNTLAPDTNAETPRTPESQRPSLNAA